MDKTFSITGTFHGSIVTAESEGKARKIFHDYYNGESIIHVRNHKKKTKINYCIIDEELIKKYNIDELYNPNSPAVAP